MRSYFGATTNSVERYKRSWIYRSTNTYMHSASLIRIHQTDSFTDKRMIEYDDLKRMIVDHCNIHTQANMVQPFLTYRMQLSSSRPLHLTDLRELPLNAIRRKQWSVSYTNHSFEIVPEVLLLLLNGLRSVILSYQ